MMIRIHSRKFRRYILAIAVLAACCHDHLVAQDNAGKGMTGEKAGLKNLMEKAQKAYHESSYLSFHIAYYYANAGKPGQYMDSLSGEVQMDKNRCRYLIDGTETILTGKYAIQISEAGKSLYLAAVDHPIGNNPLNMLDSILSYLGEVSVEVKQVGRSTVATLNFPEGRSYSAIRIEADAKTGYFQRVSYSLATRGLVEEDQIDKPGHPAPYQEHGQVEVVFNRYEQGRFGDELFNENNFFNKSAGHYQPAGKYRDYQLFLASSNL